MNYRLPALLAALAGIWFFFAPFTAQGDPAVADHASIDTMTEVESSLCALASGNGNPQRELSGLAVAVLRDGEVAFEAAFGRARIDRAGGESAPLTPDSLVRIASVSKTLSAVVILQMADEGLLDLDRDVSDYLGWQLRNPNYPDRPITLTQLLAHTSSIRDAGESYIIRYPRALREAFDPASPEFPDRFQPADGDGDRGPGVFYEYSNLNFGVIGTVLERVTGERFDVLMQQRFFTPLGLAGGFNVAAFTPGEQARLATLYRKRDADGAWHPAGEWVPQVDDLTSGIPTALPEGADYVPGTNGAQFSPQGGARMSLHGLETLARLFLGDGALGDARLLSPERAAHLRETVWRYDPDQMNVDDYRGTLHERTPGLRVISGTTAGDRLFTGDQRRWYGHFGEAYGLLAGVYAQPESGQAVIYVITGTAFDPHAEADGSSTLAPIEAAVLEQLGKIVAD